MAKKIVTHNDLDVYRKAMQAAMEILNFQDISERRNLFTHRSDPPFVSFCLHQYCRRMA